MSMVSPPFWCAERIRWVRALFADPFVSAKVKAVFCIDLAGEGYAMRQTRKGGYEIVSGPGMST